MSDRPKTGSELLLVAFGRDGLPFQVFTREGKSVHMYDFDWDDRCRTIHWHCSGVGYHELYLEHSTMPYWVAPGWKLSNGHGPRLLNLPPAFTTLEQVFAVGHEGDRHYCADGWDEDEEADEIEDAA